MVLGWLFSGVKFLSFSHQSARTAETASRPGPETARADPDQVGEQNARLAELERKLREVMESEWEPQVWAEEVPPETKKGRRRSHRLS